MKIKQAKLKESRNGIAYIKLILDDGRVLTLSPRAIMCVDYLFKSVKLELPETISNETLKELEGKEFTLPTKEVEYKGSKYPAIDFEGLFP